MRHQCDKDLRCESLTTLEPINKASCQELVGLLTKSLL